MRDGKLEERSAMYSTTEEAESLCAELNTWFERNGFLVGIVWRTPDEGSDKPNNVISSDHYFVLNYAESDFYNIMSGLPTAEQMHSQWLELFEEFDSIVTKHGFWFERINNRSLNIFGRERDTADA
jgi:hypothetical protein